MREVIVEQPDSPPFFGQVVLSDSMSAVMPFFSVRKLRLVYDEMCHTEDFEFSSFDEFKRYVLSASVPELELNKWQSIAARR